MFHVYNQGYLVENTGVYNELFSLTLLVSKAFGGFLASKNFFNDRRTQMRTTSLSAAIGLVILTLDISESFYLLLLARIFLGLSQGFFDNYYLRMIEEFTPDNKTFCKVVAQFFFKK
jgi:predicted MFS family arabinose efflux permease